jgi:hypothetical protein
MLPVEFPCWFFNNAQRYTLEQFRIIREEWTETHDAGFHFQPCYFLFAEGNNETK